MKGTRLPACKPLDVLRALERAGWIVHHSTGSHRVLKHVGRPDRVVVPFHRRDLKRATLRSILKQAGLSVDELLRLI